LFTHPHAALLSFSPCITERSTQRDMRVQAARMTHRGGSYACTWCMRRVLSRGVRISPAKGRAREVDDGRDEGAAIRSFSCW